MNHDESLAVPELELVSAVSGSVESALSSEARFRAAVMQKLAAREAGSGARDPQGSQGPWSGFGWLRAALSLLPAGFAPAAFAGPSAAQGTVAKGLLGKALGAALLPVFVAAMAVASFTASVNRTVGLRGERGRLQSEDLGRQEFVGWVKRHWLATVCVGLFFAALVYGTPLDAGVFAIAVSMLSTAVVARRLSDQGLCDRRALWAHVATAMVQLMLLLGLVAHLTDGGESLRTGLMELTGFGLVVGSAVASAPFHPRRWFQKREPLTPKLRRMDAAVTTLLTSAFALAWLALFGIRGGSGEALRQLASADVDVLSLRLPLAGLLHVVFTAVVMARAPMPRPRGKNAAARSRP